MTAVTADIVSLGVPVGFKLSRCEPGCLEEATAADFIRRRLCVFACCRRRLDEWGCGRIATIKTRNSKRCSCVLRRSKETLAHAVTADLSLEEWVDGALFCGADGV